MTYKVGQVLYVATLASGGGRVVPIQVIEEITKKTLTGEIKSYVIKMGPQNAAETVDISKIKGEIFTSADDAKRALIDRAKQGINQLVDDAVNRALEWYDAAFEERNQTIQTTVIEDLQTSNDVVTYVILEDGTKARLKNVPT